MTRRPRPISPTAQTLADSTEPAPRTKRWRGGRLGRLYRIGRMLCVLAAISATVLVGASVVGAWVGSPLWRAAIPLSFAVLGPWMVRFVVRRRLRRRYQRTLALGGWWYYVGCNAALLALFCLGFGTATGRALRRRGDFWLGQASGPLAAAVRRSIADAGRWMERFDVPSELGSTAGSGTPDVVAPGEPPRPAPVRPIAATAWVHPLAGPERRLPPNASCRFGARRPGDRPRECQLGHCGVDLAGPVGLPVRAIAAGIVKSVMRDAERGGIAGRYVILLHRDRSVKSKYIHLDSIRADLAPGASVKAGDRIGTLGRSGIKRSAPHLHFALSVKRDGRFHYIDPEPLLYIWQTAPTVTNRAVAQRSSF